MVETISIMCLLLIITSLLSAECSNLITAIKIYMVQALLLVSILVVYAFGLPNHALLLWSITVLLSKAMAIPYLFWRYLKKVDSNELGSILPASLSKVAAVVVAAIVFAITYYHYPSFAPSSELAAQPFQINMSSAAAIMALGLFTIITRKHALKTVLGLCLMENGVHMSLVSLAPTIPETAMIGVVTDVVVSVWMMLYIAGQIYSVAGSSDTCKLSKLRG